MERRYNPLPLALEKRADGELSTITGYAAVFYDAADAGTEYAYSGWWDNFVERILPGAFDQAIRDDDVRALFNHDVNLLLGRNTAATLSLAVDKKGLKYEISPPATELGRSVIAAIERGDLTGSSFSFTADEVLFREIKQPDGSMQIVRELVRVRLYDVGPVTFPAYAATTTGTRSRAVRAPDDLAAARAGYDAWKSKMTSMPQRALARARAIALD